MRKKYNKENTYYAKSLRKQATKEENRLWYDFLRNHPQKFVRQKPIDNYILDFYCAGKKLAIEIDGSQHYESEKYDYDINRTKALNKLGISVLRFTNREINQQFEVVCEHINNYIQLYDGNIKNESIVERF